MRSKLAQIVVPDCHDNTDACVASWAPINDLVKKEGWGAVIDDAQKGPATSFGSGLVPWSPISLVLTLAVYGLVRAIGWVIGGFASLRRREQRWVAPRDDQP